MSYYNMVLTSYDTASLINPQVNTFQYLSPQGVPDALEANAIADAFYDQVINAADGIKSIVTTFTHLKGLVVTAPFNPEVLAVRTFDVVGLRGGTNMPNFVSWGFKSDRTRADIRAGFKRFGRVSETDTSGDVPTAGMVGVLDDFALVLNTALDFTIGGVPVQSNQIIVKRIKYIAPSGKPAYRLPEGSDKFDYSPVNWEFQRITTQNSRKR